MPTSHPLGLTWLQPWLRQILLWAFTCFTWIVPHLKNALFFWWLWRDRGSIVSVPAEFCSCPVTSLSYPSLPYHSPILFSGPLLLGLPSQSLPHLAGLCASHSSPWPQTHLYGHFITNHYIVTSFIWSTKDWPILLSPPFGSQQWGSISNPLSLQSWRVQESSLEICFLMSYELCHSFPLLLKPRNFEQLFAFVLKLTQFHLTSTKIHRIPIPYKVSCWSNSSWRKLEITG